MLGDLTTSAPKVVVNPVEVRIRATRKALCGLACVRDSIARMSSPPCSRRRSPLHQRFGLRLGCTRMYTLPMLRHTDHKLETAAVDVGDELNSTPMLKLVLGLGSSSRNPFD